MSKPTISDITIYPVVNRKLFRARWSDLEMIEQLSLGGARIVQLREKELNDYDYFKLATLYRKESLKHNMLLIVNDRVDIALAVKADGVHLGKSDLPLKEARRIAGNDFIIGGSARSLNDALRLESEGASYINIGPIFKTKTKPDITPIGLTVLREAISTITVPLTAMGGINLKNIDQLLDVGMKHVGVIEAIFAADDIKVATRNLVEKIESRL
ncbi:MAG: thiamine phosphate synthase [Nitrospinota bacterium]